MTADATLRPLCPALCPDVFVARGPLHFLGMRIGSRMTVVRLPDGSLWLHSPIAASLALCAEIDALGPVAYIVAPNIGHHMYAGDWAALYPDAQLFGSPTLPQRHPELVFTDTLEAPQAWPWRDTLATFPIVGNLLEETAFVHRPSGTLICADLVENFREMPHTPTRLYLRANGIFGQPGFSRMLRPLFRDRPAARASVDALLEEPFERIVLAHGELIEGGGNDVLRSSFEWLRGDA